MESSITGQTPPPPSYGREEKKNFDVLINR